MFSKIKSYQLVRSRRRSIALIVTKQATLEVRAPLRISEETINKFVIAKQDWICRKMEFVKSRAKENKKKKFVDGEEFLYLGQKYPLQIHNCRRIMLKNCLLFPEHLVSAAKEYLMVWYKKQAFNIISERVFWYANHLGLQYNEVKINSAQSRWGSCSVHGNLNFSWYLVMAPLHIIDYVVVHELMHLLERNHSSRFWKKVQKVLPDYATHRRWLKDNAHFLSL